MGKLTRFTRTATVLSLSVALAACQTTGANTSGASDDEKSYCEENEKNLAICFLIGAVVVGGVVAIAASGGGGSGGGSMAGPAPGGGIVLGPGGSGAMTASDIRLKTDIRLVKVLDNGIRLHAFRYKGDDQIFVGVLAQELLADSRYAHAVHAAKNGTFRVDYDALGLELVGGTKMHDAGERALARFGTL